MEYSETEVDLALPPNQRWRLTPSRQKAARALAQTYFKDLSLGDDESSMIQGIATTVVPAPLLEEMKSLATAADTPLGKVVLTNLYYDLLKTILGCTAFAAPSEHRLIHAIDADAAAPTTMLLETSCSRRERIEVLLQAPQESLEQSIDYLSDRGVRMNITVQQMAFRARTGDWCVETRRNRKPQ